VDVARLVQNALQLLERRHSRVAFHEAIRATPGYFEDAPSRDQEAA
jgi:hypothetical protein